MPGPPDRRSVARIALAAVPWIMIGAVMTVGVAWGSVLRWHQSKATILEHDARFAQQEWAIRVPDNWPQRADWALRERSRMCSRIHQMRGNYSVNMERHGWPMRSMCVWWTDGLLSSPGLPVEGPCFRLTARWMGPLADRPLPIVPVFPGFVVSTLFYAAIAWGLWQAPLVIRRHRRRRANRCVRCGYDRAGIGKEAKCPECGAGQMANGKLPNGK